MGHVIKTTPTMVYKLERAPPPEQKSCVDALAREI